MNEIADPMREALRRKYVRRGWVPYPVPSDAAGNLVEDLDVIMALLGSAQYESLRHYDQWYIRRLC